MRAVLLLRAVNVGGTKVPMADLRSLLEGLGLRDVRTYLQSGNAVFDVDEAAGCGGRAARAGRRHRDADRPRHGAARGSARPGRRRLGGRRGREPVRRRRRRRPNSRGADVDPSWLHVTFLFGGAGEADFGPASDQAFSDAYAAAYDKLTLPAAEGEQAVFAGLPELATPVVYLCLPHGYGRTKLNNGYFERHLGAAATTRNWRTVQALVEMSAG